MKFFFILILIAASCLAHANILEGQAKNSRGDLLYIEKHYIETGSDGLNNLIKVEYIDPSGKLFAKMTSDFSESKTIPKTIFEDLRFDSTTIMKKEGKFVEFEEFKSKKLIDSKKIPVSEKMVASQGFDNFIRMNLKELESKPKEFNFGILESKEFYSLTGYKKSNNEPQQVEYGIKPTSWLIGLFADELRVVYDAKTMKLKSYIGRSNILDNSGKPQDVVINYTWKQSN